MPSLAGLGRRIGGPGALLEIRARLCAARPALALSWKRLAAALPDSRFLLEQESCPIAACIECYFFNSVLGSSKGFPLVPGLIKRPFRRRKSSQPDKKLSDKKQNNFSAKFKNLRHRRTERKPVRRAKSPPLDNPIPGPARTLNEPDVQMPIAAPATLPPGHFSTGQWQGSLEFLRGFLRHPARVGSVVPSSQHLEQRLVRHARLGEARSVVELGPGTGGTSAAFLRAMPACAQLLAIELDAGFYQRLRGAIADARVHLGQACAGLKTASARCLSSSGERSSLCVARSQVAERVGQPARAVAVELVLQGIDNFGPGADGLRKLRVHIAYV
jgi:Ribosomal RNA adenine dimethylase